MVVVAVVVAFAAAGVDSPVAMVAEAALQLHPVAQEQHSVVARVVGCSYLVAVAGLACYH